MTRFRDCAVSHQQPFRRVTGRRSRSLIRSAALQRLRDFAALQEQQAENDERRKADDLLQQFGIDDVALASIAQRLPGPGNKRDIDKARSFAAASLRALEPLLTATPGNIVIFNDQADPPRIPDRHNVVLETANDGRQSWFAVSISRNGWQTKRPVNDYTESRFLVFLMPLDDNDAREFARLVGIDESKLLTDEPMAAPLEDPAEPTMQQEPPADMSRRRGRSRNASRPGRMSDAQVAAELQRRGINPTGMPRSR